LTAYADNVKIAENVPPTRGAAWRTANSGLQLLMKCLYTAHLYLQTTIYIYIYWR